MRRSPFYAYPTFPDSFYATEAPYHRPHLPIFHPSSPSPSPSPSPAPTPRSVINIPVFNSAPSSPSQPHPRPASPPAVSLIDPSSAATKIQSCFRGFCVRRHRPLLHLRSIAKARKQLEELQLEIESPGFSLKVRASEKERLHFSECVMAIILRLDAIEGSMPEVRSQRKEATKMAIKLQDGIDAIMMQRDEIGELKPTDAPFSDVCMALDDDSAQCEQSGEPLCPDVNTVHGGLHVVSDTGVSTMQEESTSPEADVANKCMPNLDNDDIVDDIVSPLPPVKSEDAGQQVEAGELSISNSGCLESVPQVKPLEGMDDADQDMSHVTGEDAGGDATRQAEEEVNNGIDALHLEAHMKSNSLVAKVDQGNITGAHHGSARGALFEGPYTCMDVVQEIKDGCSQDVELCPGTPTSADKCDHSHFSNATHHVELQGKSTAPERLTECNCSSDGSGSPKLHRHGYENPSAEATPRDEAMPQPSSLSVAVTLSPPPDGELVHQLSEDCRQLKSLVGKLLVQNKAQSKVLCALGERLELLEHQQHLNRQRNQQQMREKRKLKKGSSKRSNKSRNCE